MKAIIGAPAPNIDVSKWAQGSPTNLDQERGRVVMVSVFQVNCPGCFAHGLPEAKFISTRYGDRGVTVLGLATAFEDFDKNTLANLKLLLKTGEVIGETRKALSIHGQLKDGKKLPYTIPFPVGMDQLTKVIPGEITDKEISAFAYDNVPDLDQHPEEIRNQVLRQVENHLKSKEYAAETFEKYSLKGTPSTIIVDREGILVEVSFGHTTDLESIISKLL